MVIEKFGCSVDSERTLMIQLAEHYPVYYTAILNQNIISEDIPWYIYKRKE